MMSMRIYTWYLEYFKHLFESQLYNDWNSCCSSVIAIYFGRNEINITSDSTISLYHDSFYYVNLQGIVMQQIKSNLKIQSYSDFM